MLLPLSNKGLLPQGQPQEQWGQCSAFPWGSPPPGAPFLPMGSPLTIPRLANGTC